MMSAITAPEPLAATSGKNGRPVAPEFAGRSLSDLTLSFSSYSQLLQFDAQQLQAELGITAQESGTEGFNFRSLLHPVDAKLLQVILSDRDNEDLPELNCRIMHNSGSYRTYKMKVEHRMDGGATIEAYHLPGADQSVEELAAFARLRALKEEVLQFGTFEFDIATGIGHWSEGLYGLFGYKTERPIVSYELFLSHIVSKDATLAVEGMLQAAVNEGGYSQEFDMITCDKVPKRIHVIGRCLYDRNGEMCRRVGIIRDITMQRNQEATINNIIDELQRSNKELEEFAYVASHDLQEPLRKITTFCGRLNEKFAGQLGPEGSLYLERAIVSAENMRILIDNLLEFSRVARVNVGFSEVSLNFVVQQVVHELELSIEETGTQIVTNGLPIVNASFSNMKQVFSNILSNAIKFRKPGTPPVINIDGKELDSDEITALKLPVHMGKYFKVSICDNGIGFEPEYAERIFKIFQRLHGKADYPGSGIGLAICRKIVEHHKGLIWAENVAGTGACFHMILPEYPNKG